MNSEFGMLSRVFGKTTEAQRHRAIAPGEPQRHRGHRERHRGKTQRGKGVAPAVTRLPGVERRQRRRSDDRRHPVKSPTVPDASIRLGRTFHRPTRLQRVGPAVVVPARAPAFESQPNQKEFERRGLRSPRARAGGSGGCSGRLRSRQPPLPAVPGRPAAGTSPVIELLCGSFVSLCLRGCDVDGWLCALSVPLWFVRCDGSASSA